MKRKHRIVLDEFLGCEDRTCCVCDDGDVVSKCKHLYAGAHFQCQLFDEDLTLLNSKLEPIRFKKCTKLEQRSVKLKVVCK